MKTNFNIVKGLTILVFILSAGLIILSARGDLWLDEIWSLNFARQAASALDILTRFKHDNNHILNTYFLYLVGPGRNFYIYHLLAVVCGIASLVALWRLTIPGGSFTVLLSLLLVGFSYPLVLMFSEARGYAPAILCSILANIQLRNCSKHFTFYNLILFWLITVLGLLAHATFAIILMALVVTTRVQLESVPVRERLERLVLLYAFPLIVLVFLYVGFFRVMTIGGGDELNTNYYFVLGHCASLLFGMPDGQPWGSVALVGYLVIVAIGTSYLYQQGDDEWIFYPFVLVICPALMLLITKPKFIYYRYFILIFPFFYLLIGKFISGLLNKKTLLVKFIFIGLILSLMSGHLARLERLLHYGRGGYLAALSDIVSQTSGSIVLIGSDHDFRNGSVIMFYKNYISTSKKIIYVDRKNIKNVRPEWIIIHSQSLSNNPKTFLNQDDKDKFRLQRVYPFAGDSGWTWMVYRRE